MAAQLTSLGNVLPGRSAFPASKSGGLTLLAEKIVHRAEDGTTYTLHHVAYHALDQSGVETVGSDTFVFDRLREEIFLIEATAILPNGSRQEVGLNGAFIQTPQREADNSLYTSEAELRVVYPNVGPGTTTEAIVLVRENIPVMPGEFAMIRSYGASWPIYQDRLVLDFPATQLARIRATGSGVPEPKTDLYAPGRERRSWERQNIPEIAWEEGGPRWAFRSPTLWLTTLDTWDRLSGWYQGLVADRSALGPALEAELDAFTAGMTEPRAIIDRLTEVVSTDIRYVGLEFGLAGYQPRPCQEVWEKRYGDCKDKANLLRAMLAYKGIRSHLVLLDTRGMGRIERTSPSWLHFNHAILAIENGTGGYLFCDPTVERLPAGSIGINDLAREVLIVKEGKAEWVQTPDLLASSIRVQADLALAADGGLSGWLTFGGTGSDAAYYASLFAGLDQNERLRRMQEYAGQFFPGAEVMDIEYTQPAAAVKVMAIRAYLVRPPRAADEQVLNFPFPTNWLPSANTSGERRFPYATSRREEVVTVTITLADNWGVRTLPAAFSAISDVAKFTAAWTSRPQKLEAQISWHPTRAVLAPSEYAVFQRSVRALTAWLEQSVVLTLSKDKVALSTTPETPEADLSTFPILPTGAGQLRLLDQNFPDGKNDVQRRAALQRVLQWFPQDTDTVFTAQLQLGLLDQPRIGDRAFAESVRVQLSRYGPQLNPHLRAWAEFLEAKARWVADHDPAAIERLQKIAGDESLSAYRRGWSAETAGRYLRESNPVAASDFLRRHAEYESEARESIVRLIASIYATAGDATGFHDWAVGLASNNTQIADTLLAAASGEIGGTKISSRTRNTLVRSLRKAFSDSTTFPQLSTQLKKLDDLNVLEDARDAYKRELATWVRKHPPSWWTAGKSPQFADSAAVIKYIRESNSAEKAEAVVDGVLQLTFYHEPSFPDLAVYARYALWWLNKGGFNEALLETWGRATLLLPPTHEDVIDCWSIAGTHFAQKKDPAEGRRILQRIIDDPAAAKYQRIGAGGELGLLEMRAGNIPEALDAFHQFQSFHTAHKWSSDYLYVAVLLHLQRGELDAALDLLTSIQQQEQKYLDQSDHHQALGHLLRAAQNPEGLKRYWQRQPGFRDAWNAVLASYKLRPALANSPPLRTDYAAYGDRLAKAAVTKNAKAFVQELDHFARLAQWVPIFTSDFIKQAAKTDAIAPSLQQALYTCALLLVSDSEPVDPEFDGSAKIWEVALLGDMGRRAEASAKARLAVKELGTDTPAGQNVLCTWAVFARGTDEDQEVTGMLAAEFAGKREMADRSRFLRTLSDSYHLNGNTAANRALLERETARQDFNPKSENGHVLVARLETLRTSGESAETFTREVKSWMSHRDLGWIEHVPPASLNDTRFAALKAPIFQEPPGFSSAEIMKFNLLAAFDERLSPEIRGQALYAVAFEYAFRCGDVHEFAATLADAAALEILPSDSRATCTFVVLNGLLRFGHTALAAEIAAKPAFELLKAELRSDYDRAYRALLIADAAGENWETRSWAILSEKPFERFSLGVAERIVRQLALRGEYTRAEQLISNAKELKLDAAVAQSPGAIRLEWTRWVRTIRDHGQLLAQLRTMVKALPEAQDRGPRIVDRFGLNNFTALTGQERLALVAKTLETGTALPEDTRQLLWVLGSAPNFAEKYPMFFPDLLETSLRSEAPDSVKSIFVSLTALGSDVDRSDVRQRVGKLLADFSHSVGSLNQPQTHQAVATARAIHALRTSRDSRPDELFNAAQVASLPSEERLGLQLRFHFSRGQKNEALQLVQMLRADQLTHPELFVIARSILLEDNRTLEVELLDESMKAVLNQRMPDLWLVPELVTGGNWFFAAAALGSESIFTSVWFDRAIAATDAVSRKNSLRVYQAWLREDWAALREAADAVFEATPDVYDLCYLRAVARHRLHDSAGAIADLETFLHYSLSSENYQRAVALYRELTSTEEGAPLHSTHPLVSALDVNRYSSMMPRCTAAVTASVRSET